MNIQKTWFTAALSAGLLLPALALSGERVETFDFSRAGDGVIGGRNPAVIRTLSPYGRFRGASALTIPGKTYPANALDRNGEWKALRFGSAKEYFTIPGFHLEPGKPFTIETWMRIYSQKPPLDGFLMDAGFGYKTGFRLVAVRSKRWAQEGWINLICGDGKTSRMLLGKNGSVNTWHHVVITTAGNAPALYIDGIPARSERPELSPLQFHFAKNTPVLVGGSPRGGCDVKIDFLSVYDRAMSADEVKKRYEAGRKSVSNEAREKLLASIKLEIPRNTQGYFRTGASIPVTVSAPAELKADSVSINGKQYKPGEPVSLRFEKPGVYEIAIALSSGGKVLRSALYPIAVIPAPKDSARTGNTAIASKTPASHALGSRLSREVFRWNELEPKKGEYNWELADRIMKWNQENGVETIFCLTGIPGWAKIPRDLEQYRKLWRLIFARYDLKYAEVWNATAARWTHCDPAVYKQLLTAAKSAAKEEDESIRILAGRFRPGNSASQQLLKEFPDSCDIISADFTSDNPGNRTIEQLCRTAGKKPVWITSGGCSQQIPGVPPVKWLKEEKSSAAAEIRSAVLALADGAEEWIASMGPDEYLPAPNTADGRPGWKGVAWGVFHSLIGKNAKFQRLPSKPDVTLIRYENPDKTSGLIVFAPRGKALIQSPAEGIGLFGTKIGKGAVEAGYEPLYLPGISNL